MTLELNCDPHDEFALLSALVASPEIGIRNLEVRMGEPCGVVIAYGVHVRAVWHAGGGDYDLIPGGYNEPVLIVHSLAEVVPATLEFLNTAPEVARTPARCMCKAC